MATKYVPDDKFMVTYGDGVSSVSIRNLLKHHSRMEEKYNIYTTITVAHPSSKYGQLVADRRNVVRQFDEKPKLSEYINGGFMVLSKKSLRYLRKGKSLEEGLEEMTDDGKLSQYKHEGFWHGMDTMKDFIYLNKEWEEKRSWAQQK